VTLDVLLGCYSDPVRDPRGHTASLVYIGHASGEPVADDDAAKLALFDPARIDMPLAFDHARILRDYLKYRDSGIFAPL
jgi:8-oxo-dGTP diphosphatase